MKQILTYLLLGFLIVTITGCSQFKVKATSEPYHSDEEAQNEDAPLN